jgi:hypothetical protein
MMEVRVPIPTVVSSVLLTPPGSMIVVKLHSDYDFWPISCAGRALVENGRRICEEVKCTREGRSVRVCK